MINWKDHKPETFEMRHGWVYNWFSNMIVSPITIDDITYKSVENYFQSHKSLDVKEHQRLSNVSPSMSKREGRSLQLRSDWEDIKYDVMKTALRVKFSSPPWKELLLSTGHSIIIEWNNWNDRIWGVSIKDCEGQNLLGKALMEVRDELRQ